MSHLSNRTDVPNRWLYCELGVIILVQLLSIILAGTVVLLLAMIYDAANRSMSWFSNPWMLFGLYLCPFAFVLGSGPAAYIAIKRRLVARSKCPDEPRTSVGYQIQMFLFAQCILFAILSLILTVAMVKTSFLINFIVMFYNLAAFINLVFKFIHHGKRGAVKLCRPFCFFF